MTTQSEDLEEIAALLDGALQGEDRRRVVKHLAESGDSYRLFIDAATDVHGKGSPSEWEREEKQINRQLDEPDRPNLRQSLPRVTEVVLGVLDRFRSPSREFTLVLAATATAAVTFLVVYPHLSGVPRVDAGTLAARMDRVALVETLAEGWETPVWAVMRGGAPTGEGVPSFRLGVRFMDLQIALAMNDYPAIQALRPEIDSMLGTIALPQSILAMLRTLDTGSSFRSEQASKIVSRLESVLLTRLDSTRFAYGSLVEAARIAALVGDTSFLRSREGHDALARLEDQLMDQETRAGFQLARELLEAETDAAHTATHLRTTIRHEAH